MQPVSWTLWLAFFVAAWAISLSPGPGAVAVMGAALRHGVRRGYWMVPGLILGFWTQLAVVAAGLGALLVTSTLAFEIAKWTGVAYLVWLGIRQWRATEVPLTADPASRAPAPSRRRLVAEGWALNAVNPKGTAFMLAVVPQFLVPTEPLLPQYLAIGATLAFTDLVVNAFFAAGAARLVGVLRTPRRMRLMNRVFGGLFIGFGLLLATLRRT